MVITTNHSASSYGQPVILDDDGNLVDYTKGIRAVRATLSLSTGGLAELCGVSKRTVEGWEQGRLPGAAALNAMADALDADS